MKTLLLVLVARMVGSTGNVLLAKGMKTIGDLTDAPTSMLGGMIARTISNPWIAAGVMLQGAFFFMYLALLSRADVSKLAPMMLSVDSIVVALLAQAFLAEPVTPARWAGIGFIAAGVFVVSRT